jgi:hypothetical protein
LAWQRQQPPPRPEPNWGTPASALGTNPWINRSMPLRPPASIPLACTRTSFLEPQPASSVLVSLRSWTTPGKVDYAREGDAIVVVGIDRLGRNAAEVMTTIRDLGERGIVLRSLREGIDTSNATGRMVAGVLASLAELELELGRERRSAAREARRNRGQPIGRPKVLSEAQAALALRMHASGESAITIANTLKVSRATIYRALSVGGN